MPILRILYFGDPEVRRLPSRGSFKPPRDYGGQEQIEDLLRTHSGDLQITYIDIRSPSNEHLLSQYNITDSHVWIIEFDDGTFEKYEHDFPFLTRLDEFHVY